ncbi:MAG: CotH kinase family protein, partial [Vallitaleaceae bacterium]|nr:CotH kinase family protein [Vallitaleaceae bacterium]
YYIEDQSFYGISKLNLNNIFGDASYMREYMAYEALESLDSVASRTTYAQLYINDEYFGLYLSVEDVNDDYLYDNYGSNNGELYKPEMAGGSDLDYIDDDPDSYNGITPDDGSSSDNEDIINLMKVIESGENLEDVFNVDGFLKYLAVSTFTVNMDSYQGGMFHNYYLYNDDGYFEWIPWDLNMAFNGFPAMTDEEAVNLLIDEPVLGALSEYPLIETILANEDYMLTYHGYLEELMANYFDEDNFTSKVEWIFELIDTYVEEDPTSFYTYDEFVAKVHESNETTMSLLDFVSERTASIGAQMAGTISSTNDGQGNTSSGGFNVGGNFGRVGGAGFATNGKPAAPTNRDDSQATDGVDPNAMTDGMPQGDAVAGVDGGVDAWVDGVGDMETLILEALKGFDNLPDDLAEFVNNDTLPPKELVDSFLAENNIDMMTLMLVSNPDVALEGGPIDGNQTDQTTMGPDGTDQADMAVADGDAQDMRSNNNQDMKPGGDMMNTASSVVVEEISDTYSLAGYIGLGGLLLITLLITFVISKKK